MNRKIKSTLGLVALLLFILIAGGVYIFVFQGRKIKDRNAQIEELNKKNLDQNQLFAREQDLIKQVNSLDSILSQRRFNIPMNLSSIKFFDFVNGISKSFSEDTKINIEYYEQRPAKEFFLYEYKLTGNADYNDLYSLIYAIEQSKELKKIYNVSLINMVSASETEEPKFLVTFSMVVDVYFSTDDRYTTREFVENNLNAAVKYNAFFPLLRNEIPPNLDNLLDVQTAKLLAIIPEGAFLADANGETYLLWEGEQVYLGYLTKIDFDNNKVTFILNKGGIVEKKTLTLEREPDLKKLK